MISSKIWGNTLLCWLLALPLARTQNTTIVTPVAPKWEFGIRGGAGFNKTHIARHYQYAYGENATQREYYLGGYATRHFGSRWSLRSELSLLTTPSTPNNLELTVGLLSRYRLTHWLSLEAGLEAKQVISGFNRNNSNLWLGTVLNWKNVEFNLRYAPSYAPTTPFACGGWGGNFQVGASFRLAKVGKLLKGK